MEQPKTPEARSWLREIYAARRFTILLLVLIALLVGPEILTGMGVSAVWYDVLVSTAVFAAILSLCTVRQQRLFALAVGPPAILSSVGGRVGSGEVAEIALMTSHFFQALFFFGTALLVVRSMFAGHRLTSDSVAGAATGYIFLGLGWAVIFTFFESVQPGSFEFSEPLAELLEGGTSERELLTYYSFVTLTTVGFGDITAIGHAVRSMTWLEAVSGQFYLAVVVAAVVSLLVNSRQAQHLQQFDYSKLAGGISPNRGSENSEKD